MTVGYILLVLLVSGGWLWWATIPSAGMKQMRANQAMLTQQALWTPTPVPATATQTWRDNERSFSLLPAVSPTAAPTLVPASPSPAVTVYPIAVCWERCYIRSEIADFPDDMIWSAPYRFYNEDEFLKARGDSD